MAAAEIRQARSAWFFKAELAPRFRALFMRMIEKASKGSCKSSNSMSLKARMPNVLLAALQFLSTPIPFDAATGKANSAQAFGGKALAVQALGASIGIIFVRAGNALPSKAFLRKPCTWLDVPDPECLLLWFVYALRSFPRQIAGLRQPRCACGAQRPFVHG